MVLENTEKFGNVTVGIHGQELPKFAATSESKQWWRYEQASKMKPKIQSRLLLKQTQQYWAKNDENLLADMSHEPMPIDHFKKERVPIEINKPLPEKVTSIQHVDDRNMTKIADTKFGYKAQKSWTTSQIEFGAGSNTTNRLFDRVVAEANRYENSKEERAKKLRDYMDQPQRGTNGQGHRASEDPSRYMQQMPMSKPAPRMASVDRAPRTMAKEASNQDSMVMPSSNQEASVTSVHNHAIQMTNMSAFNKSSLFSRVSPGTTVKSPAGGMTSRTAASSSNTVGGTQVNSGANTAAKATSRNAASSPFKDAMSKGVLSGTGLLTH